SQKVDEAVRAAQALQKLEEFDEQLSDDQQALADIERSARTDIFFDIDKDWAGEIDKYAGLEKYARYQDKESAGSDRKEVAKVRKLLDEDRKRLSELRGAERREWIRQLADLYIAQRGRQRDELAANMGVIYGVHPFFGVLPPQALARVAEPTS